MVPLLILLSMLTPGAPAVTTSPGLIIVTTDRIVARSAMLETYITEKEAHGFHVTLVTESDYGAHDLLGLERGLAIRAHLATIAHDYQYALLLGDPDPDWGDFPLFTVWPRHTYSDSECGGFALDCRACQTDYLYADLTGNWDLNGNGQYGETELDEGSGGIDFDPELYVGRIPVYFDDVRELDQILQNNIDYMNASPEEAAYRSKVLLPASFLYYKGQRMTSYTLYKDVDGAETTEWLVDNILTDATGISWYRMYELEGASPTRYEAEQQLTQESFIEEWHHGYGIVMWVVHGIDTKVARTLWPEDLDLDGAADNDEILSVDLIRSSDASRIGTTTPGFVIPVSCEVGSAEVPGNLTYALLLHNAAIGMIASTSVTPAGSFNWSDPDFIFPTAVLGGDNLGVYFIEQLIAGLPAGQAFYEGKVEIGDEGLVESMAGKMMMNYYGDPSLTLYTNAQDRTEPSTPPPAGSDGGCSHSRTPASFPLWFALLAALALMLRLRKSFAVHATNQPPRGAQ